MVLDLCSLHSSSRSSLLHSLCRDTRLFGLSTGFGQWAAPGKHSKTRVGGNGGYVSLELPSAWPSAVYRW